MHWAYSETEEGQVECMTAEVDCIELVVTRNETYGDWTADYGGILEAAPIDSTAVEEAQAEAIQLLKDKLDSIRAELP